jgi:hypothetical protein
LAHDSQRGGNGWLYSLSLLFSPCYHPNVGCWQ